MVSRAIMVRLYIVTCNLCCTKLEPRTFSSHYKLYHRATHFEDSKFEFWHKLRILAIRILIFNMSKW